MLVKLKNKQTASRGRVMRLLPVFLLFCTPAIFAAPLVEVDPVNGRAETIRNLDINGTLYNASFDQAFGANVFDGDVVGAEAAVDALVDALNPDHDNVDNGHPLQVPVFWVMFDSVSFSGSSACQSVYVPECSSGDWANVGELYGGIAAAALVFFERVPAQVAIDVLPGDAANKVYPNKGGKLPVAILSSAEFDAGQVDPATLRFGSAEAPIAEPVSIVNVDNEFGDDTVAKFSMGQTGIFCNDTEVSLSGATYAGDAFAGTDSIDASECEDGGCHAY
jgi:hypothetical protein